MSAPTHPSVHFITWSLTEEPGRARYVATARDEKGETLAVADASTAEGALAAIGVGNPRAHIHAIYSQRFGEGYEFRASKDHDGATVA